MSRTRSYLPLVLVLGLVGATDAHAADLAGAWQVQSMGSDRALSIEQQGERVVIHRVMWPQFEGQRYRLEHLYRGTIEGTKVRGDLLVKEEGLAEFEVLRTFDGIIRSPDAMVLDGMSVERTDNVTKPAPKRQPSEPVVAPTAPTTPAVAAVPPATTDDPGVALYGNIMGGAAGNLFKISATVRIPDETRELTGAGDVLYAQGKIAAALVKYQEAAKDAAGARVELLHRMGRCHLKLNHNEEARAMLGRALRLDPGNGDIKRDYKAAKRHSRGRSDH